MKKSAITSGTTQYQVDHACSMWTTKDEQSLLTLFSKFCSKKSLQYIFCEMKLATFSVPANTVNSLPYYAFLIRLVFLNWIGDEMKQNLYLTVWIELELLGE